MILEELLNIDKEILSQNDIKIIQYLLSNKEEIIFITSEDISKKIGVSVSTISRFWKKIGFKNIKDFKQELTIADDITPASKVKNSICKITKSEDIKDIILNNIKNLEKTFEYFDINNLNKAVQLITKRKRIFIYAPDVSKGIAEVLVYRLRRFNIEFTIINGGSSIYEDIIHIKKDDVVIIFSYSKILSEVKVLMEHSKIAKYKTIIFSDLVFSNLTEESSVFLYSYRGEPREYHSMVSCLSIIDCIIIKVAMIKEDSIDSIGELDRVRSMYKGYIKR